MIGRLDRRLARLDHRIWAAHGRVETAYALNLDEAHKQEAFRALDALLAERDALRREWSAPVRRERPRPPVRALFGPGEDEVPVYDPGALVL
ncbi:hypothetical protein GBA65_21970 (plasmid) [Rubrobacter marinus]|uniref:Uncharacterized protein n=1 Tax=Rubrobacter marinus TaxID=2653852 RepID=A0A6G8Q3M9_9ACTN|nr:hypothetical protein [Rubrobacter marinus]QIN81104.1 hypothetical protein GBA65_21970 [Rubrobacter marinus]